MKLAQFEFLAVAVLLAISATQTFAQRSNQGMGPLLDRAQVKAGDEVESLLRGSLL